jgi:hypothetical protein
MRFAFALTLAFSNAARRSLIASIFITFCVLPPVSRDVLNTWACESFGASHGGSISFMRTHPEVDCDSEEHDRLEGVSWAFLVFWPICMPLVRLATSSLLAPLRMSPRTPAQAYLWMLHQCREALVKHQPTALSTATRFLWREYREAYYWWEPVETLRKLLITSFVVLLDIDDGFLKLGRLFAGSLVSLFFLTLTLTAQPYRSLIDNYISAVSQLMLCCAFTAGIVFKICDDSKVGIWGEAPCKDIVGLDTNWKAGVIMVATTVAMLLSSVVLIWWQLHHMPKVHVVRLKKSGHVPLLQLRSGQTWHLFLSHSKPCASRTRALPTV